MNFTMKIKSVIFFCTLFWGLVNSFHLYNKDSSGAVKNLNYNTEFASFDGHQNLYKTRAVSASEFLNAIEPAFLLKKKIRKHITEESENRTAESLADTQNLVEYFKKYPEFEVQFLKTLENICQKYNIVEDRHKNTFINLNQHNVKLNENFQNFLRNELVGLFHGLKVHNSSPPIIHSHAYCPILDEWLKLRNATVINSSTNYTNFQYNTPNHIHKISDKKKFKAEESIPEFPEEFEGQGSENKFRIEKKLENHQDSSNFKENSRTVHEFREPIHESTATTTEDSSLVKSQIPDDELLPESTTATRTLIVEDHPLNNTRRNNIDFLKNQHRNTTKVIVKPITVTEKPKQKFPSTRPLPKVFLPKNITKSNTDQYEMKSQNLKSSIEEESQTGIETDSKSEKESLSESESTRILSTIELSTTINDTNINSDEGLILESRVINDIISKTMINITEQLNVEDNIEVTPYQNVTEDAIINQIEVTTEPKFNENKEEHSSVFIVHPSNYNSTESNSSNLNYNITNVSIVTPINTNKKSNIINNVESDVLHEDSTNRPELINDPNLNITATTEYLSKSVDVLKIQTNHSSDADVEENSTDLNKIRFNQNVTIEEVNSQTPHIKSDTTETGHETTVVPTDLNTS